MEEVTNVSHVSKDVKKDLLIKSRGVRGVFEGNGDEFQMVQRLHVHGGVDAWSTVTVRTKKKLNFYDGLTEEKRFFFCSLFFCCVPHLSYLQQGL